MIRTGEKNLSAQGVFEINNEQREELLHRFEIDAEDNEVIAEHISLLRVIFHSWNHKHGTVLHLYLMI